MYRNAALLLLRRLRAVPSLSWINNDYNAVDELKMNYVRVIQVTNPIVHFIRFSEDSPCECDYIISFSDTTGMKSPLPNPRLNNQTFVDRLNHAIIMNYQKI